MSTRAPVAEKGVEANARLTGVTGALLLVILFFEGLTILRVRELIGLHVFLGALLLPPVLLKTATTSFRFLKYYRGERAYVRRGPPHPILRVTGPLVVISTLGLLVSGIVALLQRSGGMLGIHRLVFIAWFVLMTIHVLGHFFTTARLVYDEWRPGAVQLPGRRARTALIAVVLIVGVAFGAALVPSASTWSRDRHQIAIKR